MEEIGCLFDVKNYRAAGSGVGLINKRARNLRSLLDGRVISKILLGIPVNVCFCMFGISHSRSSAINYALNCKFFALRSFWTQKLPNSFEIAYLHVIIIKMLNVIIILEFIAAAIVYFMCTLVSIVINRFRF